MMNVRIFCWPLAILAIFLMPLLSSLPAGALSMKECSARYKAAQGAGGADGMSWADFRKAQCSTPPDDAADKKAEGAAAVKPGKAVKNNEPEAGAASGDTIYPSSVAAKFASETPAKARMHTCLEQYRANKAANRLGGLRWIEKGGGYYKKCNNRLKGNS
jgi:hypothetical protein